jgi:hypothetical protein
LLRLPPKSTTAEGGRVRKSEALYYPNIEPPIAWLRSAALLFDTVRSIVPLDTEAFLSQELLDFAEYTEAWVPFRPTEGTALLLDISDHDLDEAFSSIPSKWKEAKKLEIIIEPSGQQRVTDHVFMHRSKLSDRVCDRLEAHGLMLPPEFNEGDWRIVNEQASDLVLSYIADRLAARQGWTSITDREGFYVFNAVGRANSFNPPDNADDRLARLMVTELIPDVIDRLSIEKYSELRKRYEPIRERLSLFVNQMVLENRLGHIGDAAELEEAIQDCVRDLKKEVLSFRASNLGKAVRKWAPFSISSLITIAGRAAHLDPVWSMSLGGAGIVLSILDKTGILQNRVMKHGEMVRLLAAARNDIIGSLDIKRYLVP